MVRTALKQEALVPTAPSLWFQGYYKRTLEYPLIREWKRMGCFAVPMVHSTFLIDLRKEASAKLAFYPPHQDYTWSFDDIMVFAFSSRQAGVSRASAGEGSLLGTHRPPLQPRSPKVLGGLPWGAHTLLPFLSGIWSGMTSSK